MVRISLVDHDDLEPDQRDLLEVLSDPENVPEEYRHLLIGIIVANRRFRSPSFGAMSRFSPGKL